MQKIETSNFDNLPAKTVKYNAFKSVRYAITGIYTAFSREPNLTFQVLVGLSFSLLGIATGRWITAMANLILMGIVISLEMINTVVETLCDLVHPDYHPKVKIIKDMAAGAVLIVALVWLVVIIYQILIIFVFKNVPF